MQPTSFGAHSRRRCPFSSTSTIFTLLKGTASPTDPAFRMPPLGFTEVAAVPSVCPYPSISNSPVCFSKRYRKSTYTKILVSHPRPGGRSTPTTHDRHPADPPKRERVAPQKGYRRHKGLVSIRANWPSSTCACDRRGPSWAVVDRRGPSWNLLN